MILKSSQEKIAFLEECLFHIDRLFKRLKHKKGQSQNLNLYKNNETTSQTKNCLTDKNLPISITINGNLPPKNFTVGKLMVLTSLYNNVAAHLIEEAKADLEIEFNKVKQNLHFTLLRNGLPSADILMKKQRHYFLRNGVLGYILSYIWAPKSSNFLTKYEFFTKKADWEDDFNFRYDLANNCHFDVNLISNIESIGMGLGYIIKTKSAEEASIIMKAIRTQLPEDNLADSIRFIDPKNLSPKVESSATIEVWGYAVDALDNLIDKNQNKMH